MSRPNRHPTTRAVAALAVVGGLVVGLPTALVAGARGRFGSANPLAGLDPPWRWPFDRVGAALGDPLNDDTVVDVVIRTCLVTVWIALVVLIATIVAELVHQVRQRGLPVPRVRGLGPAQRIARWVVAGLLLLPPVASASASSASTPTPLLATLDTGRTRLELVLRDHQRTASAPHHDLHDTGPERPLGISRPARTDVVDPPPDGGRTHVVRRGESVYSIAATIAAGDEARTVTIAHAILDANLGRPMAGGRTFTNPAYVEIGWELLIPPPAGRAAAAPIGPTHRTEHLVTPGETLSGIAADELGDGRQWPAIWAANAGREMTDGRRFDDPDLILPGWQLTIPPAAPTPSPDPTPTDPAPGDDRDDQSARTPPPTAQPDSGDDRDDRRTAEDSPAADPPPAADPTPAEDSPAADATPADQRADPRPADDVVPDDAHVTTVHDPAITHDPATTHDPVIDDLATAGAAGSDARTAAGAPDPTTTPATTTTTAAPDGGPAVGVGPESRPRPTAPIRLEHAAFLAAGVLTLIAVHRRRRLRRALSGARIPDPAPEVTDLERELRISGAGERALRVDVAVRAVAAELVRGAPPPAHDSGGEPGRGRDADDPAEPAVPTQLAQVGMVLLADDGALSVHLTAPAHLTAPWRGAERMWTLPPSVPVDQLADAARRVGAPCVALVHVGRTPDGRDVLVDLEAAGELSVEGPAAAADDVVAAIAATTAATESAETAHLITVSLAPDTLLGHPNSHAADDLDAAVELAAALAGPTASHDRTTFDLRARRTGGHAWEPALVFATSADGPLAAQARGQLAAPGHGMAMIVASGPSVATTTEPASPTAGVVAADVAVAVDAAEGRCRLRHDDDDWLLEAFDERLVISPVVLPVADAARLHDLVSSSIVPPVDEVSDGPVVGLDDERADDRSAPTGTPASDDDFRPGEHAIVVRLLGPVDVVAPDGRPARFTRSKSVELIAWLATHRERATRTAARTALWELDVRDATFANVVSEARRALARLVEPPDDGEWLARTLNEQLPLHPAVVTDADLVAARLEHARSQRPELAVATLRPAVEMIRDLAFSGTTYLWPDAEGITSRLVLLCTSVCVELAGHALDAGDVELLFDATDRGLRVLPGHEELIGLRMRAHATTGDLAGVRQEWAAYERVIVADPWSDGEPAPKLAALRRELLGASST